MNKYQNDCGLVTFRINSINKFLLKFLSYLMLSAIKVTKLTNFSYLFLHAKKCLPFLILFSNFELEILLFSYHWYLKYALLRFRTYAYVRIHCALYDGRFCNFIFCLTVVYLLQIISKSFKK